MENSNIGHFSIGWVGRHIMVLLWTCTSISLLSVGFFLRFLTEERSYEGLKDATSFGLISDKSAEIRGSEYWKNCQFSIRNWPFSPSCSYANEPSDVTSPEIVTFGQDFRDFLLACSTGALLRFEFISFNYSTITQSNA